MKISQLFLAIGLLAVLPAMGMMVVRDQHGYAVRDGNKFTRVKPWDMDKISSQLSKMDPAIYKRFVEVGGKLRASRLSNGDYYLRDKSGLDGSGPVLAALFYWGTKIALYGSAAAAIPAAAATVAPAVAAGAGIAASAASGLGVTVSTAATATVIESVAASAVGVISGGGTVAGTVLGAVGAGTGAAAGAGATGAAAVATTGAVVMAAGGIAEAVAAVETASTFMGFLGALIPGPI